MTTIWHNGESSPARDRTGSTAQVTEDVATAVRGLLASPEVEVTLQHGVELTRDHLPHADWVSVSLISGRRRVVTPASTHAWATEADRLQYATGQGPCLEAIHTQEVVALDDLAVDGAARFPEWARLVQETTGIRSSLSYRLFTAREELGALNVYSGTAGAFPAEERAEGHLLSAHLASVVSAARQLQGLQTAVDGRTVIGQAQGILMERHKITAERAFELLSRVSQDTNTRLRDLAARVVATGETPGLRSP